MIRLTLLALALAPRFCDRRGCHWDDDLGYWWWWWRWRRWFGHRPHVHRDGPVGLNHGLPDLGEDDLAVRSYKVVVAFVDVWADHINVEKRLLD